MTVQDILNLTAFGVALIGTMIIGTHLQDRFERWNYDRKWRANYRR